MKIKKNIAALLNKTAKVFLVWEEWLMKEPAAIIPKTNLPKVKSVGKATWLSLIFGAAGQIYLGQVKKGWLIIIFSAATSIIGVGVLILILGMIDANVIAKRIKESEREREGEGNTFKLNRKMSISTLIIVFIGFLLFIIVIIIDNKKNNNKFSGV